jgi:hypothetical protein
MIETVKSLKELFIRDLDRLTNEIESFSDESQLWKLSGDIKNTPGNLCLHICGNLKFFIGTNIGNTGYVRQRDDEFGLKNIPKSELLQNIQETNKIVEASLNKFDTSLLDQPYPIEVFGKPITHINFLIHLSGHLNYHLGQINYNRRLNH